MRADQKLAALAELEAAIRGFATVTAAWNLASE
jgi:hypothetical protein